jgi:hypothetical protein
VSKTPAPYGSLNIEERKAWAHPSFGGSYTKSRWTLDIPGDLKGHTYRQN